MNPAPPVTRRRMAGRLPAHLGEALVQAVTPVWEPRRSCTGAAQHRIRRARSRSAELLGRHPTHAAGEAGLIEDRLCKVGPRALAVRGDVPETEGRIASREL